MDQPAHLPSVEVAISPAEKFAEFLKTQGMRPTQERKTIVDEVFRSHEHFDADQLIERLAHRTDGRRVSRATVYRALELLEEAGLLRRVTRTQGRVVYEHDYGYPQHDHFICQECGKLIEFENQSIRKFLEEVAAEIGFLLDSHRLEAFGRCLECSRPKQRPGKLNLL